MRKKTGRPIVAVVGRPNVGKSTLFNTLAGERISIVQDTPGITRDRIYADVTWLKYAFTMIDTGGIEPESKDVLLSQMREQAQIAIDTADVIIFLVDVRSGLQDADAQVADLLRRSHKPVVLAVNKVDNFEKYEADVYEFYNLGIGEPIPVSAQSKLGLGDLLDAVVAYFPEGAGEDTEDTRPRIAIIGKPNVGKSSLINKLLGEDRLIVSDVAGTTRDAVDTDVTYNGKEYVFIDTAGLRRKNKVKEDLEHYMILRTVAAVERADIAVLVIDAREGVTEQDAKIAGIAHDRGKAVIIAVNKWDAVEKDDKTIYRFTEDIRQVLSFMPYAEILFISALSGQRLPKLFETIEEVGPAIIRARHPRAEDICANVDLYSGLVYDMLGIPKDLYTPIFAVARCVSWCAHRMEELVNEGPIIRPAYKPIYRPRKYVKLSARKGFLGLLSK